MNILLPERLSDQVVAALTAYTRLLGGGGEPPFTKDPRVALDLLHNACRVASAHISQQIGSDEILFGWGKMIARLVQAIYEVQAWEEQVSHWIVAEISDSIKDLRSVRSVSELLRRGCSEMARIISVESVMLSKSGSNRIEPAALHGEGLDPLMSFHATKSSAERLVMSSGLSVSTYQCGVAASVEATRILRSSRQLIVPVSVGRKVIGIFHIADEDAPLVDLQKDGANLFASCFAAVMDRLLVEDAQNHRLQALHAVANDYLKTTTSVSALNAGIFAETDIAPSGVTALEDPDRYLHAPPTGREREVLKLILEGASNQHIASELVISIHTVKSHVKKILRKLGASNRTEIISRYAHLAGRL
ncbi:helix-turn-helix transcriptional regulator [Arthrobacter sp. P2b]|uniref:helix-turn-helix transcriptional regulator n=1 Tax=Arthrobacter sp. P2b TaxID=1938741 RepID=UPI0009A6542B|nr:helix-turn-helix transcriptional regulator [Arthrobacter sp. P2b]SLK10506.1 regulatory protein, luxR family [Arthrobacter sp. P2b]